MRMSVAIISVAWMKQNFLHKPTIWSGGSAIAGCVSFGQRWKNGTGRRYFADIIGLSSTTLT